MKIIAGLGNPDAKYKNTYHNLGFMAVEKSAELFGATFCKEKFRALVAETTVDGEKILFLKPLTYMNLSGESIREAVTFYKVEPKDLIVIYDDFDLEKGALRIRPNGSAGTHNGMRNIISLLSTDKFPRIRIGFKPEGNNRIPLIDLVLSGISEEDKPLFEQATTRASKAVYEFVKSGDIEATMRKFNGKAK
ncbi:MAG: aminoacyl-tRNA hydrolase [Clostridiales bacterium]|nr:aminoacyl-tRNA hydrolase [Clostridiales bacterium]